MRITLGLWVVFLASFVACAPFGLTHGALSLTQRDGFAVGTLAPDFQGTDQDGKKFKLSDYRGKVVVLDFWGDW